MPDGPTHHHKRQSDGKQYILLGWPSEICTRASVYITSKTAFCSYIEIYFYEPGRILRALGQKKRKKQYCNKSKTNKKEHRKWTIFKIWLQDNQNSEKQVHFGLLIIQKTSSIFVIAHFAGPNETTLRGSWRQTEPRYCTKYLPLITGSLQTFPRGMSPKRGELG